MSAEKRIRKRANHSVVALSKEFADSTSMHGLKFIVQENASFPERLLWMFLFLGGFFFAIFFSYKLWDNWQTSPVLTTIHSANCPVNDQPFPTVTICSVNKVSTKALENWMLTPEARFFKVDEMRRILEILSTNQVDNVAEVIALSKLLIQANITTENEQYENLINSMSPNCSDMAVYCTWENRVEECSDLFQTEATDNGYCCSFNSNIISRNSSHSEKVLRRARSNGVYGGLAVILDAELEDYNVTSAFFTGFRVSIQHPDDFPRTGHVGFMVAPGHQIEVSVTSQIQQSDNDLGSIGLNKRLCATADEIKLSYFPNYTGSYCQLDCLTRISLAKCGCVPYHFPVPASLRVCDLSSYPCLQERVNDYVMSNTSVCHCPDLCNNIWYQREISSGNGPNPAASYPSTLFTKVSKFRNMTKKDFQAYAKVNIVQLNVFFKTITGLCYIMNQRTTWADFISTGGLFGLGFGFSILSAAELFYFMLIRWLYHWHQSNRQKAAESRTPAVFTVAPISRRHRSHHTMNSDLNASPSPHHKSTFNDNRIAGDIYYQSGNNLVHAWLGK